MMMLMEVDICQGPRSARKGSRAPLSPERHSDLSKFAVTLLNR